MQGWIWSIPGQEGGDGASWDAGLDLEHPKAGRWRWASWDAEVDLEHPRAGRWRWNILGCRAGFGASHGGRMDVEHPWARIWRGGSWAQPPANGLFPRDVEPPAPIDEEEEEEEGSGSCPLVAEETAAPCAVFCASKGSVCLPPCSPNISFAL